MKINTTRWNRIRYTLWAPFYDLVARFDRQRERSIRMLELRPGERVLLVGAGTGADLPFIPRGVEVVAGDITPAMVDRLRRRASRLGFPVRAEVLDGQKLPLPDESFDAVILHLIVAVIPDPLSCVREAARVLRPHGRAVVFDKFVREGEEPSLLRRALNVPANALFSDITRSLDRIVTGSRFRIEHREPAGFGGIFQIALLRKGD